MKKIISIGCFLLVFSCVLGLWIPNVNAATDVSQNKKIVSVVYDDSGSMIGANRFVYANYAMQTFCSLLGAEDELYLIRMNADQTPQRIDLTDSRVQSSVDDIRNFPSPNGVTPFDSVVRAMNVLRGANDTNETTDYILLVITDGAFTGYDNDAGPVRAEFNAFADERMANGTKPQVIYLGIGSATQLGLHANNIKEFYASNEMTGENSIVSKMSEIANLVSGRSQIASADIKTIDEKTLEMTSNVPISNIAALVQGSAGKIAGVTHKETGKRLNVGRNVSSYCLGFASLASQSFLITSGKENIPAGTYVLNFDQPVSAENVVLMAEPALELRLSIECNGREIDKLTELDGLREKDLISVSYKIYEYGTDQEVLLSELPQGTQTSLCVLEDGVEKQKVSGVQNTIHRYELSRSKTVFKATLQLPDFNPIEAYIDFTPLKYVHYTVEAAYGSSTQSVKLNDIKGPHDLSLVFTLLADGVPVTDPETVKAFVPTVTLSPNGNDGEKTVRADGKFVFVPKIAPSQGFVNGSMTVTAVCSVNGASATATYTVTEPVYEVKAEYGSGTESIKLTEIGNPHDLSIVFTVWEDGVRITDKAKIESLGYRAEPSPKDGNEGETALTDDGKIIFKPNKAKEKGVVTVTCTVGTAQQTKTYEVLAPVYTVKAEYGSGTESIKLTEIGNPHDLSIVFTVWEDGVRITDKAKIESLGYRAEPSPKDGNEGETALTDDGKIIFKPNKAKEKGVVTVTCTVGTAQQTKTYEVLASAYTVKAEYGSDVREIHLDHIEKDHGLSIIFTVYEENVRITDKATVEAMIPQFTYSEDGADGDHVVTEDGRIIFKPTKAYGKTGVSSYNVTVTCTVGGANASETYKILLPNIEIIAAEPEKAIPKHEFYGNTVSVSFYIVKDGKRLTKAEIEVLEPQILQAKHADNLQISCEIAEDGTVTCTPFAPNEHQVDFFGWFVNWQWYWSLPGEDVTILFSSNYGTKEGVIPVCRAPFWQYQMLMAAVPFALELAFVIFLAWWFFCMIKKPKFPKEGRLYIGDISLVKSKDPDVGYYHRLRSFRVYSLKRYNTWKYIIKPTLKPLEVTLAGVHFKATREGPQCQTVCYRARVSSLNGGAQNVMNIATSRLPMSIRELSASTGMDMKDLILNTPDATRCYLFPAAKKVDENGLTHVSSAVIMFYA